ncbi:DUF1653 domain-containing protein [Paenibacillus silvae]|uniref:DUF1653 domain-containing protein n=1 Tax=Paenibacillus silvae TaxID=1325358 RepID=A0A2W6NQ32_9BACL|nr:DUF1653 domain-containing protein [Paenibacillus silvae]PZT57368.1 DUF1653 domain-containing protein [Paenibacillus silvae]
MIYDVAQGQRFKHYKGGIYTFLCFATHTEQQEGLVVYMDESKQVWARPVDMFFGYTNDGLKRFIEINEE